MQRQAVTDFKHEILALFSWLHHMGKKKTKCHSGKYSHAQNIGTGWDELKKHASFLFTHHKFISQIFDLYSVRGLKLSGKA